MKHSILRFAKPLTITLLVGSTISACTTFNIDDSIAWTNDEAAPFTAGNLELARNDRQRAARLATADALLSEPLSRDAAVKLALANSPSIQALLARNWENGANAAQSGRIPNPVFSLERLVSDDSATRDIERFISFGLLDVLLVPMRTRASEKSVEAARIRLTTEVVREVSLVRQAWTQAVAARQIAAYTEQVQTSAKASAEMGRRLESVGNFSRLERARQQVFHADATMQLASARNAAVAAREELTRALGLDDQQAARLQLPEQLPALPELPILPDEVTQTMGEQRLDIRMARASLDRAARSEGIENISSLTDVELGYRETEARGPEETEELSGYEVELRLPLFDWGGLQRDATRARTLAAANDFAATVRNASSSLRQTYSAYRTSYDISSFYRDEVVPLRQLISEETVMQYNGMLIGVFDLLADSRTQIDTVLSAIKAAEQFWIADAALQASMLGSPMNASVASIETASAGDAAGH